MILHLPDGRRFQFDPRGRIFARQELIRQADNKYELAEHQAAIAEYQREIDSAPQVPMLRLGRKE